MLHSPDVLSSCLFIEQVNIRDAINSAAYSHFLSKVVNMKPVFQQCPYYSKIANASSTTSLIDSYRSFERCEIEKKFGKLNQLYSLASPNTQVGCVNNNYLDRCTGKTIFKVEKVRFFLSSDSDEREIDGVDVSEKKDCSSDDNIPLKELEIYKKDEANFSVETFFIDVPTANQNCMSLVPCKDEMKVQPIEVQTADHSSDTALQSSSIALRLLFFDEPSNSLRQREKYISQTAFMSCVFGAINSLENVGVMNERNMHIGYLLILILCKLFDSEKPCSHESFQLSDHSNFSFLQNFVAEVQWLNRNHSATECCECSQAVQRLCLTQRLFSVSAIGSNLAHENMNLSCFHFSKELLCLSTRKNVSALLDFILRCILDSTRALFNDISKKAINSSDRMRCIAPVPSSDRSLQSELDFTNNPAVEPNFVPDSAFSSTLPSISDVQLMSELDSVPNSSSVASPDISPNENPELLSLLNLGDRSSGSGCKYVIDFTAACRWDPYIIGTPALSRSHCLHTVDAQTQYSISDTENIQKFVDIRNELQQESFCPDLQYISTNAKVYSAASGTEFQLSSRSRSIGAGSYEGHECEMGEANGKSVTECLNSRICYVCLDNERLCTSAATHLVGKEKCRSSDKNIYASCSSIRGRGLYEIDHCCECCCTRRSSSQSDRLSCYNNSSNQNNVKSVSCPDINCMHHRRSRHSATSSGASLCQCCTPLSRSTMYHTILNLITDHNIKIAELFENHIQALQCLLLDIQKQLYF